MSVTKSIIYEAYFDLWGFAGKDIEEIQDAIMDFSTVDEECESYANAACTATRFRSEDKTRVDEAIRLYKRLTRNKKKRKDIDGYVFN
jgi:hypothetical protein